MEVLVNKAVSSERLRNVLEQKIVEKFIFMRSILENVWVDTQTNIDLNFQVLLRRRQDHTIPEIFSSTQPGKRSPSYHQRVSTPQQMFSCSFSNAFKTTTFHNTTERLLFFTNLPQWHRDVKARREIFVVVIGLTRRTFSISILILDTLHQNNLRQEFLYQVCNNFYFENKNCEIIVPVLQARILNK